MTALTVTQRPIRTRARRRSPLFVAPAPRPARVAGSAGAARVGGTMQVSRRRRTMYLRRRIAAVLTILVVAAAISGLWAMRSNAAPDAGLTATVVVGQGETVWDIAVEYLPEGHNAQVYVAEIVRANDIDAAAVAPGTVLQLPRP